MKNKKTDSASMIEKQGVRGQTQNNEVDRKALASSENIHPLVKRASVDYSEVLDPPPAVLRINNEIVGTLGNFSQIIGKAKSKKTYAVSLIMGSIENPNESANIAVDLPGNKPNVLFFDTEQSEYKVVEIAHRVCRLNEVERPYDRLKVFSLRQFNPGERRIIIEEVLKTETNVGLVIIDGIRDLVNSINSEEESTEIASKLLKWTTIFNLHIVNVLHQNKSDNNARGHIGTELINKAETTINVEAISDGSSIVSCQYARHKEFQPFAFTIDDQGLPVYVSQDQYSFVVDRRTAPKKADPKNLKHEQCEEILKTIRESFEKPSYSELVEAIQGAVESTLGESIGTSKAKKYKIFFEKEGGIQQEGTEGTKNSYYTIHPDAFN